MACCFNLRLLPVQQKRCVPITAVIEPMRQKLDRRIPATQQQRPCKLRSTGKYLLPQNQCIAVKKDLRGQSENCGAHAIASR
jgi:hypothetical protein